MLQTHLVRIRDHITQRLGLLELIPPLCPTRIRIRPKNVRPTHDSTRLDDVREGEHDFGVGVGFLSFDGLVLSTDETSSHSCRSSTESASEVSEVEEIERDRLFREREKERKKTSASVASSKASNQVRDGGGTTYPLLNDVFLLSLLLLPFSDLHETSGDDCEGRKIGGTGGQFDATKLRAQSNENER